MKSVTRVWPCWLLIAGHCFPAKMKSKPYLKERKQIKAASNFTQMWV